MKIYRKYYMKIIIIIIDKHVKQIIRNYTNTATIIINISHHHPKPTNEPTNHPAVIQPNLWRYGRHDNGHDLNVIIRRFNTNTFVPSFFRSFFPTVYWLYAIWKNMIFHMIISHHHPFETCSHSTSHHHYNVTFMLHVC